ncbi:MAG TPA: hypothetical protein VII45_10115 [Solirubrobacterales bacterium]
MLSSRRLACALTALALIPVAAVTAQSAGAAKPLAAPRSGPWKIIAAANTFDGLEVKGGVVGSFRVTKHGTIAGFHMGFTEEGESSYCAGGEEETDQKKGVIRLAAGASAPIVHANGEWLVAVNTGSLGGGSLEGVEVPIVTPSGGSGAALMYLTLATRKGMRSGNIEWNEQQCNLAFVVKPG